MPKRIDRKRTAKPPRTRRARPSPAPRDPSPAAPAVAETPTPAPKQSFSRFEDRPMTRPIGFHEEKNWPIVEHFFLALANNLYDLRDFFGDDSSRVGEGGPPRCPMSAHEMQNLRWRFMDLERTVPLLMQSFGVQLDLARTEDQFFHERGQGSLEVEEGYRRQGEELKARDEIERKECLRTRDTWTPPPSKKVA